MPTTHSQFATGNCNCVSTLSAILGGGYRNLIGSYGFEVDALVSLNFIDVKDDLSPPVTPEYHDLWEYLRGAGPNFRMLTSAVEQDEIGCASQQHSLARQYQNY